MSFHVRNVQGDCAGLWPESPAKQLFLFGPAPSGRLEFSRKVMWYNKASLSLSSKTVQPTTLLCPDSRQMVSQGRQLRISGSSEGSAPQSTRRVRAAPASPGRAHKTSSQNHPPKKIIKVKHKNTYPGHVKTNAFRCPPCRPHPSPSRSPKQCWPWRVPCGSSSWAERIG